MAKKGFIIFLSVLLCLGSFECKAQGRSDNDSLVSLLSAQYARLFEKEDVQYRMIKGPAVFLHNGAYMYCDSAIWNLETDIIDAFYNVKLVQDQTVLTSDHLTYTVAEDLAEFTGNLVELYDAEGNVFRSNNLSYNTRDSIAVSRRGGTMRDHDGNVIEGDTGTYDAKAGTFTFSGDTHVFMDTLFLRSTVIRYDSNENRVHFGRDTRMWYEDYFMRADDGWYDRDNDVVYFRLNVYMNDPDYEGWCEELYYYRQESTIDMYTNVQVQDTTHKAVLMANSAHLVIDTLTNDMDATMTQRPALVYYGNRDSNNEPDSLFLTADTLFYYTRQMRELPEELFTEGNSLRKDILFDAIKEADDKAYQDYQDKKRLALEKTAEYQAMMRRRTTAARRALDSLTRAEAPVPDTIYTLLGQKVPADALITVQEQNVIAAAASPSSDVIYSATDSTSLAFFNAYYNVKVYRNRIQGKCDSLYYSDVDSIARMSGNPVLWENVKNQLTSDVMMFVLNQDGLYRGNMQNNAMITSQEDEMHFDQIKSTEMMGHFVDNELARFDALGGVTALIYLREDNALTTMNSKDSRFLMVTMKDGDAQRFKYYEQTSSDAYPVAGLSLDRQRLKGFNWRGDERPKTRMDITTAKVRSSERRRYSLLIQPNFRYTNQYFDQYMADVYDEILYNRIKRDSLERVRADYRALMEDMDNFVNRVVVPALEEEDALNESLLREMAQEDVRLWGIEPQPEEPESSILSIKLQAQNNSSQKYNISYFFVSLRDFKKQQNEGIHLSGPGFTVFRDGEGSIRYETHCQRVV